MEVEIKRKNTILFFNYTRIFCRSCNYKQDYLFIFMALSNKFMNFPHNYKLNVFIAVELKMDISEIGP